MKWFDIPPVWLLGALVVTYFLAADGPVGAGFAGAAFAHPVFYNLGTACVGVGVGFIVLAAVQMFRHNTTVIPHLDAAHLVKSGLFAVSRNPIYLGDVLVLAGCILRWDAVLAVPLIPALIWTLRVRFIVPEEARLRRDFGADFDNYVARTRRWI